MRSIHHVFKSRNTRQLRSIHVFKSRDTRQLRSTHRHTMCSNRETQDSCVRQLRSIHHVFKSRDTRQLRSIQVFKSRDTRQLRSTHRHTMCSNRETQDSCVRQLRSIHHVFKSRDTRQLRSIQVFKSRDTRQLRSTHRHTMCSNRETQDSCVRQLRSIHHVFKSRDTTQLRSIQVFKWRHKTVA